MRTDPRSACANDKEIFLFAFLHDLLFHPFMALTAYSRLSLALHNWSSHLAWPRPKQFVRRWEVVEETLFGPLLLEELSPNIWRIHHGRVDHAVTLQARSIAEAELKAMRWFEQLGAEFGGKFSAGVFP